MQGLKTVASNLANRINQQHYLEIELRKVFEDGIKYAANNNNWISAKVATPVFIENENYSENVLAIVEGYEEIQVMCYMYAKDDDNNSGFVWANAYGKIDGEAYFDDEYNVIEWCYVPKKTKK